MSKFVTPAGLPEDIWTALRALGLPENCTAATIRLNGNEPISIEATYYAAAPEGHEHSLLRLTKTMRLVEMVDMEQPQAA